MTGFETRGLRPEPRHRDAFAKAFYIGFNRSLRRRLSVQLLYGNSWSGWLENGNPHGDPRPGPIVEPRGLLTNETSRTIGKVTF